nr:hypothetical protein [Tanacetum cinerariifolium]
NPEYLEYLAPSDDEAPLEDQPLPADASPTIASPGYVADSDPDEDPEEDPEDDHDDYPADGGDGDDDDDADTDDEDEEPFEDEEEEDHLALANSSVVPIVDLVLLDEDPFEDEEEEDHLALANSSVVPIVDLVLLVGDTEALEADELTPTPRSPHTIIPLS